MLCGYSSSFECIFGHLVIYGMNNVGNIFANNVEVVYNPQRINHIPKIFIEYKKAKQKWYVIIYRIFKQFISALEQKYISISYSWQSKTLTRRHKSSLMVGRSFSSNCSRCHFPNRPNLITLLDLTKTEQHK